MNRVQVVISAQISDLVLNRVYLQAARDAGVQVIMDAGGTEGELPGVKHVLVKLDEKGSALFTEGEEAIRQPIIAAAEVIDTTGASDTSTAAFVVALVEGKSKEECMRFFAAAASLCVQVKGAIPSMPERKTALDALQSL
ncbi:hypothetical protein IFM89_028860 [Coptis chinensis]|uniref:Carbohydrate kinase PfkB domain-containing protein n=1 Tax=Coptis chinensis TaxID=261450 RepID=A0A835LG29_9MAGN|nr:hypothetical protein IFM89_028860 [Coptis chinensis]